MRGDVGEGEIDRGERGEVEGEEGRGRGEGRGR